MAMPNPALTALKRLLGTRHGFLTRRVGIFGEAEKLYFDMVEEVKNPKKWKY